MQMSHQEMKQIFLMFKNIERHATQHFEKRLGISFTRYEILHKLFHKGSLSQIGLQQEMKIDQAAITRHLKILEGKGFVARNRNEHNNREVIVQLTEDGKDILKNCDIDKNQFWDELFGGFSEEEIQQLQRLVKKLDQSVEILK